ncbi:hypothetical protein OTU49_014916, partial [Cherax quadricarinatus]
RVIISSKDLSMDSYTKEMYLVVLATLFIFIGVWCFFDEWVQELEVDRTQLQQEVQEASWACESLAERMCGIPGMGIIVNCDRYTPLEVPGSQVSPWWAPNSWSLLGIIFRWYQASSDVKELEIVIKEIKESCQDNSSSKQMLVLLRVIVTVLGVLYFILQCFRRIIRKILIVSSSSNTVVSAELVPATADDAGTS